MPNWDVHYPHHNHSYHYIIRDVTTRQPTDDPTTENRNTWQHLSGAVPSPHCTPYYYHQNHRSRQDFFPFPIFSFSVSLSPSNFTFPNSTWEKDTHNSHARTHALVLTQCLCWTQKNQKRKTSTRRWLTSKKPSCDSASLAGLRVITTSQQRSRAVVEREASLKLLLLIWSLIFLPVMTLPQIHLHLRLQRRLPLLHLFLLLEPTTLQNHLQSKFFSSLCLPFISIPYGCSHRKFGSFFFCWYEVLVWD